MAASDKKPVGFATHIIAGGIAGMSEAVSASSLSPFRLYRLLTAGDG